MDNVLNWFKVNAFIFWRIVDKTTGSTVASYNNEEGNIDDSFELLASNLQFLKDGKYSVFARKSLKATNGENEFNFLKGSDHAVAGLSSEIGYIMQIEGLKRELSEQKMKHEIHLIKLEAKKQSTQPDFLDRMTKVIDLLGNEKNVKNEIAGNGEDQTTEDQKKLGANLEKLGEHLTLHEMVKLTGSLSNYLKINPEGLKEQLKQNGLL